jgi:hypothetical protein
MSVKGEMYKSKKAMMKHEKTESPAMRMKEYGAKKKVAKKAAMKKMGKKK